MKPHIQHSHREFRSAKPRYGTRYYLSVAGWLLVVGLLYLVWSLLVPG